jgi:hypothetical protein
MSRTAIPFADVRAIERAIEQLDDGAFAVLLQWFDRYADQRWSRHDVARVQPPAFKVAQPVACYHVRVRTPA